ncbi:MAG: hypothetical protein ACRD8W_12345 [Nitrososphaeraceae archaeon]
MDLDSDSSFIASVVCPKSLRRPPSENFNPQVDKGEEIKFTEQAVNLQEYITDNGFRIFVRPVPTKVFRYNKYNAFGEPVYNVILQQITNMEKWNRQEPR